MQPELKNRVQTRIPTRHGEFTLYYYSNNIDNKEHIAFVKSEVKGLSKVPVRMHSECFTGDVLGSRRCDCGEQLDMALQLIDQAGKGVLIYLRQEGRGIGLLKKLQAYNLQDQGLDTVDANIQLGHLPDERNYSIAALILKDLGINSIQLITNNPHKIDELKQLGIHVEQRIAIEPDYHHDNVDYLKAKAEKMSHLLSFANAHSESIVAQLEFILPLIVQLQQQKIQRNRPFVTFAYDKNSGVNAKASSTQVLTTILRRHHDAVLVDISTVLEDDPGLNVDGLQIDDPEPVIFDYSLCFPEQAALMQESTKRPIIYTCSKTWANQDEAKINRLMQRGVRFIRVDETSTGQLDITAVLASLADLHINTLLVESNSVLAQQFIDHGVADYGVIVFSEITATTKKEIEAHCHSVFQNSHYVSHQLDSMYIVCGAISH